MPDSSQSKIPATNPNAAKNHGRNDIARRGNVCNSSPDKRGDRFEECSKRDDIVWAQNSGYWIGPKAIKEYYGKTVTRESTKGMFVWHTVTTPVVEVARDRKTAKGVWYTPGVVGGFDINSFNWMFER
jgi:hypothetical protein